MGSNSGPLQSAVRWADTAGHLKDFATKNDLPNIVKVTKGQYRNIGVAKSVHSELYLHSIKSSKKILAEGIKIKESKKTTIQTLDQKYALPISYQGWFELLSENGKAIRAIQSVQELVRAAPSKCLIRENVKAYGAKDNEDMTPDKPRTLHSGEQLTLVGEVGVPVQAGKTLSKKRLLRCVDSKGDTVYLPIEQKGMFSPIAGQGNISGVHNMKGLLDKFRLPIMVRLVHGIIPAKLEKNSFTGIFRLLNIYSDETAFVTPLKRDCKMVPISTREPLRLVPCQNFDEIKELEEAKYYHHRSSKMISSYMNSIHVLVNPPDPSSFERKSPKDTNRSGRQDTKEHLTPKSEAGSILDKVISKTEEDILFEEIDDIYQYVRDGGKPPPPRPRPSSFQSCPPVSPTSPHSNHLIHQSSPARPSTASPTTSAGSQNDLSKQDENYWEEPIYDEIAKYKRKKEMELDLVSAGITVSVDVQTQKEKHTDGGRDETGKAYATSNPNLFTGSGNILSSPSSPSPVPSPVVSSMMHTSTSNLTRSAMRLSSEPVANLRQMYKQNANEYDPHGSRPSSFNISDDDDVFRDRLSPHLNSSPPPPQLPPKWFDHEGGSNPCSNSGSVDEIRRLSLDPREGMASARRNSTTSLSTNISNVPVGPGPGSNSVSVTLALAPAESPPSNSLNSQVNHRSPGRASVMVTSNTAVSSEQNLAYNNQSPSNGGIIHKKRISYNNPIPGTKYVAVARVGDDPESKNNYNHKSSRISNVTKHVQSMYL